MFGWQLRLQLTSIKHTNKHDIKVHLYIIYIAENPLFLLCRSSVHIDRHTHAHVLSGNLQLVDMITSGLLSCFL